MVRAETNLAIAKTRLAVEDEAKSYDERIKALDTAIKLEQETIDEQLRLAKEREAIITAQVEQSESLEEDLQRQADARAAVIELETASLRTQKRLEGERQSLLLQRQAEQDRIAAEEAKRIEDEQKAREKEIEDERKAAEAKLKLEEKRLADEQKAKDEAAKKDKERRDKELADERALLEQKRAMTFAALSALNDLSNAFAKNDEEGARRAFKRNKALSLASAVLNTSQAITDALAKDATFPARASSRRQPQGRPVLLKSKTSARRSSKEATRHHRRPKTGDRREVLQPERQRTRSASPRPRVLG